MLRHETAYTHEEFRRIEKQAFAEARNALSPRDIDSYSNTREGVFHAAIEKLESKFGFTKVPIQSSSSMYTFSRIPDFTPPQTRKLY